MIFFTLQWYACTTDCDITIMIYMPFAKMIDFHFEFGFSFLRRHVKRPLILQLAGGVLDLSLILRIVLQVFTWLLSRTCGLIWFSDHRTIDFEYWKYGMRQIWSTDTVEFPLCISLLR